MCPSASANPPIDRMFSEIPSGRKIARTIRIVIGAVTIGISAEAKSPRNRQDHHRHREHDFEQRIPQAVEGAFDEHRAVIHSLDLHSRGQPGLDFLELGL